MLAASLGLAVLSQMPLALTPGVVITRSGRVPAGQYLRPSQGGAPAITVRGDNLTIDFQNALLLGSPMTVEPDQRAGIGIRVEGKNVVLRNVRVRGYKVGILAENSPGFMLLDSDVSYNWKQRLRSTIEREDSSDWMSFHQNDNNEWLRYGAGVYISNSDGFKLRDVIARGGQCGAMITRSNRGTIVNSDFSFLSGIGIGLYRSSDNVIMHNRVDWCVRGYSHGKWNRGQDSAGILVYEQSHRNVVAYNSVTHGGDGFFLWAGQTTMDTGEGGSNDNLLYGNDFSHAPTNGIEATFSRNRFVNNLIQECWHGLWGGYSYETQVVGNTFALNATSIAIEHGQDNRINYNRFSRDHEAIQLWSRASQPSDWGYAAKRDVTSRDFEVRGNVFEDITGHVLDVRGVYGLQVWQNQFRSNARIFAPSPVVEKLRFSQNQIRMARDESEPEWKKLAEPASVGQRNTINYVPSARPKASLMRPDGNVRTELEGTTRQYLQRFKSDWNPIKERMSPFVKRFWVRPLPGGETPFLRDGTLRGRRYILIDNWGPYDFRSPVLWPREESWSDAGRRVRFEVLGPFGRWRVKGLRGATLDRTSGQVPGYITATIPPTGTTDVVIELEYRGQRTRDYRGVEFPAGSVVPFAWRDFRVPMRWKVQFWPYSPETQEPRTMPEAFATLLETAPAFEERRTELNYDFWDSPYPGGPKDHFASAAETEFNVPAGSYRLITQADDGVRVWLDDNILVDEWKFSPPATYERQVRLGGRHKIRIEHFEIDGFAQLKFRIER